ncbi:unnamed protein product [Sphagnum jensenii]|uniref:Uncharacterized protein n=1 Tax=Sphagnum jensenii TaxID=128206 RepID=A0ABP1BUY0_9BRYO
MFSNSSDPAASPQGVYTKESGRKQGSLGVLYLISSIMLLRMGSVSSLVAVAAVCIGVLFVMPSCYILRALPSCCSKREC